MFTKNELVLAGIVILAGSAMLLGWMFVMTPELKNANDHFELRIETFEHWEMAETFGSDKFFDQYARGEQMAEVIEDNGSEIKIRFYEFTQDVMTDEVIWETEEFVTVDRNSRKSLEYDSYFLFPLNTQKENHNFGFFGDKVHEFSFSKELNVNGIDVYEFSTVDTYDISGAYEKYPDVEIFADQTTSYEVEPITGQIISYNAYWQDYTIDNGERKIISNGSAEVSEYSRDVLLDNAKQKILLYYIYDVIIPGFVIGGTAITLFFVLVVHKLIRKQKELQTKEKEKFELIGRLSSNIAHDLRNPLSVIRNVSEMMQLRNQDQDAKTKEHWKMMDKGIQRMTHQIDDVLDFVRKREPKYSIIDLKGLLKETVEVISKPDDVEISIPDSNVTIEGDKGQLQTVFANLTLNSIQAMDKKQGKITFRINEKKDDVSIEIEDSGRGIPESEKNKIFEPLYTTKQEGTGLGLSSVQNIIENHEGKILVKSCHPAIIQITLPKSLDKTKEKIPNKTS